METLEGRNAVFVTRAQPFHLGHLDAVHQIAKADDIDGLYIVVGSDQYSHYLSNPFTTPERIKQIEQSLDLDKPFSITSIRHFHNPPLWAIHLRLLCPNADIVYTNNPAVAVPLEKLGMEARHLRANLGTCATLVREKMINSENWQSLVPEGTRQVIEDPQVDGVARLVKLHNRHLRASNTADLIIRDEVGRIALVERGHEPFEGLLAIPGGFLNVGRETLPQAAVREAKEETGLNIKTSDIQLLNIYSDPERDPRGPVIATVFYTNKFEGMAKAGDDAKRLYWLRQDEIPEILAFDHRQPILADYFTWIGGECSGG